MFRRCANNEWVGLKPRLFFFFFFNHQSSPALDLNDTSTVQSQTSYKSLTANPVEEGGTSRNTGGGKNQRRSQLPGVRGFTFNRI